MTELYVVRHGPTHAKGLVGWTDLDADLSDHAALARLHAHLPDAARVVSSDLRRAIQTADAIAGDRPRLPHDRGLREMHFGEWEMVNPRALPAPERAKFAAFWDNPDLARAPGGEGWRDFATRIERAIDRLASADPGPLIVVAHFGVAVAMIQQADRLDPAEAMALRIDNLSVTSFKRMGGHWQTDAINHRP